MLSYSTLLYNCDFGHHTFYTYNFLHNSAVITINPAWKPLGSCTYIDRSHNAKIQKKVNARGLSPFNPVEYISLPTRVLINT